MKKEKDLSYLDTWRKDYEAKRDSLTEQTCTKCQKCKPINEFAKRKLTSGTWGYEKQCKECRNPVNRMPADYFKEYHKKYYKKKPVISKVCVVCGNEFETTQLNKIKCSHKCKPKRVSLLISKECSQCGKVYKTYPSTDKKYCSRECAWIAVTNPIPYKKRRCAVDVNFRLSEQIRKKIYLTLRGTNKYVHSLELLGCSADYARHHIETQFKKGMSWDNWAIDGWHIDHIKPIASFDLTDLEQQRQCFHYTNLQPLWAKDNYAKSDKIIEKQLVLI